MLLAGIPAVLIAAILVTNMRIDIVKVARRCRG